jgi:hypothetical protein
VRRRRVELDGHSRRPDVHRPDGRDGAVADERRQHQYLDDTDDHVQLIVELRRERRDLGGVR